MYLQKSKSKIMKTQVSQHERVGIERTELCQISSHDMSKKFLNNLLRNFTMSMNVHRNHKLHVNLCRDLVKLWNINLAKIQHRSYTISHVHATRMPEDCDALKVWENCDIFGCCCCLLLHGDGQQRGAALLLKDNLQVRSPGHPGLSLSMTEACELTWPVRVTGCKGSRRRVTVLGMLLP